MLITYNKKCDKEVVYPIAIDYRLLENLFAEKDC